MKGGPHDYREVTRFAVELVTIKYLGGNLASVMRAKFPGISNRTIRKALGDARLLLALRQIINQKEGD
jgi:hypothetical protein